MSNERLLNFTANFKLDGFVLTDWRTHNMGLKEMAGAVHKQTVLLSIYICACRQVSASKPRLTASPGTLPVSLKDDSATINRRIKI